MNYEFCLNEHIDFDFFNVLVFEYFKVEREIVLCEIRRTVNA